MTNKIQSYLNSKTEAYPLVIFRIMFGFIMAFSMIRFYSKGWIKTLYLDPKFHFSYFGFEWVAPLGNATYLLFFLCFILSIMIALGYYYRQAIILFFITFTYIELMDKTTYLNHYYFISVLSFLMIFLPCNVLFSLDNLTSKTKSLAIPKWTIDSLKLLISIIYFYAGLAKINSDWLQKAMPLKIWLPSKYNIPVIGEWLMHENWVHYFMSWGGMIYDLIIPFLLLYRKTRIFSFLLVVFFHVFTSVLFPIGMFPYIMIGSALIFFDIPFHKSIIEWFEKTLKPLKKIVFPSLSPSLNKLKLPDYQLKNSSLKLSILTVFFMLQILFPFRYLLYPGELFWTEEGYRFSWRVMLVEKMGYANFKIVNGDNNNYFYVNNKDFLTPFQEKQMSFQPDFILEYAHFLGDHFKSQGHKNIEVYVDCFVALNGRKSRRLIDNTVNLYAQNESFKTKDWILPFNDEIKGL